jgi:UDP-GlcNAc:undecaprenyl-phosphate GlcNAc-1-phosphate transferase
MFLIFGLGLTAFILSLLLTPLVRNLSRAWGVLDRPDGVRKCHPGPIPRVGGVAIAISYIASFGLVLVVPFSFGAVVRDAAPEVGKLLVAGAIVFATGLLDDIFSLRPWQKLSGQVLAAIVAYMSGVEIQVFDGWGAQSWITLPVSVLWLLACTNAFNLIDGLDGLAAGVGVFATVTMLMAGLTQGNLYLALVTMPLVGALLGFLRYNFNPASIFLGDCGSMLLGFLLGTYGAVWGQKSATLLGMTAPLLAVSIPILDVTLAVIRRFLRHQPLFNGDHGHIHHMLLDRGFTPRRVVLLMYAVAGFVASLSLLQDALHNQFAGLIVLLFCVFAWIGVQHLGYAEFAVARQLFLKGTFRRIIDSQTRLRQLELRLDSAISLDEWWVALGSASAMLGLRGIRMHFDNRSFENHDSNEAYVDGWQLRIPLSRDDYVNLECLQTSELNPVLIEAFVKIVRRTLHDRSARRDGPLNPIESKNDLTPSKGYGTARAPSQIPAAGTAAVRARSAAR